MASILAPSADLFSGLGAMIGKVTPKTLDRTMPGLPKAPKPSQPAPVPEGSAESSFELLLLAKEGDTDAMERLCARYLPRLKRWAHGRLPPSSRGLLDTQDLAQEVLCLAVRHIDTFEPRHEGAFQGYMRQTLLNRVRDEARRSRRRPMSVILEDEHAAADPSPLELAIGQETLDRYEAALQRLEPQERELIVARVEFRFSVAEIAAALGKPSPGAAQMAIGRALVRLAKEMAHG